MGSSTLRRLVLGLVVVAAGCDGPVPRAAPTSSSVAERALKGALSDDFEGVASVQTGGRPETVARGDAAIDSAYDIGSIAKDFTIAAVLTLARDGKLKLDDPISRHLPGVPREEARVTVRQLLRHRAGLPEYVSSSDFDALSKREALELIWSEPLRFRPGTRRAYSNAGYTVLAALVEEVADEPFTEFVTRRVIAPAGLTQTGFYTDDLWREGQVVEGGNENRYRTNVPDEWPLTWALIGAGGMISTAEDLHRWARAFFGGEVVDSGALRDLLGADERGLLPAVVAGGNNFGFNAFAAHVPGKTTRLVTIVVLSNSGTPFSAPAEEVGERLLRELAEPPNG